MVPAPSQPSRPRISLPYRPLLGIAGGLGLALAVMVILAQESLQPLPVGAAVVGLAAVAVALGIHRKALIIVVALNLVAILLYSWSLGETIHVQVTASPQGYVANVGGNLVQIPEPPNKPYFRYQFGYGRVGLYSANASHYNEDPLGPTPIPLNVPFLTGLAQDLRFITPAPAWKNLHATTTTRGVTTSHSTATIRTVAGTWTTNPRGELQGSLGSYGYFPFQAHGHFTFSGDLVRPDGLQGVLLGVGGFGHGFILGTRMDNRDAAFFHWFHAPIGLYRSNTATFSVDLVSMIQRTLRFFLPSVILALLMVLVAVGLYAALLPLALAVRAVGQAVARRTRGALSFPDRPASSGDPGASEDGAPAARSWYERYRWLPRMGMVADGLALIAVGAALVFMAHVATAVLPGIPHVSDGVADLFEGRTFAMGRLSAPIPRLPVFFSEEYLLQTNGQWFGKFPPGYPLALAIGVLAGRPWLVGPVVTALGIGLLYLIGSRMYGRPVGLMAALLACTSPILLIVGSSFFPQSTTWLFLAAFVLAMVLWDQRYGPTEGFRLRWSTAGWWLLTIAGLFLGLSFATRSLDTLALALPFFYLLVRRPLSVAWVAAGTAGPLAAYALYQKALTGSFLTNTYTLAGRPFDKLGFGPGVGGPTPYFADFTVARSFWNISINLVHIQIGLFGWPCYFALALPLLPFVVGRANRWDWMVAASALLLVGGYGLYFWSGITYTFPRYWFVIAPWLILLTGRGFQELYLLPSRLLGLGFSSARRVAPAAAIGPLVLAGVLLAVNFTQFLPGMIQFLHPYAVRQRSALIIARRMNIHNAVVFEEAPTGSFAPYGESFSQNTPLLKGDIIWARDQGAADVKLMRLYPGRKYYYLLGHALVRINRRATPPPLITPTPVPTATAAGKRP